jgi:hypothetical protein
MAMAMTVIHPHLCFSQAVLAHTSRLEVTARKHGSRPLTDSIVCLHVVSDPRVLTRVYVLTCLKVGHDPECLLPQGRGVRHVMEDPRSVRLSDRGREARRTYRCVDEMTLDDALRIVGSLQSTKTGVNELS